MIMLRFFSCAQICEILVTLSEYGDQMQPTDLVSLCNSLMQDPDLKGYISEDALRVIQSLIGKKTKEDRNPSPGENE